MKEEKNMKKILLAILALALALGSSMPVYAATQTTTMPVSVTIVPAVTVSVTSLSFGSVVQGDWAHGYATITVNAINLLAYTVTLDAGLNYSGGGVRRLMSGATLGGSYHLHHDFDIPWGDSGFAGTFPDGSGLPGRGSAANPTQTLRVYGLLYASSTLGTFTDTVTVTVHY